MKNPFGTPKKGPGGRPSSYKPEYAKIARFLCQRGAIDKEIAEALGVVESTINLWKIEHPEFSESLKAAKDEADSEVVRSLFERATGYSHPAVKILAVDKVVQEVPYTEHYPPDATSMIFWLKNRKPSEWRDKIETDVTSGGKPIEPQIVIWAGQKIAI